MILRVLAGCNLTLSDTADNEPPVITLNGPTFISICQDSTFEDPGVVITDNIDVSSVLLMNLDITESPPLDLSVPASYNLFYDVMDSAGNEAETKTRIIQVLAKTNSACDSIPPELTLEGETEIVFCIGDTFEEPGFSVSDNAASQEQLQSFVMISGNFSDSITSPGVYVILYDVTDPAGNMALTQTRVINVLSSTAEECILGKILVSLSLSLSIYIYMFVHTYMCFSLAE